MKKTICTLILISFVLTVMHAQVKVDSLINVLETKGLTPLEQMIIYEELCNAKINNNIEECQFYANKGLTIANKEKDKQQIGIFKEWQGIIYDALGKDSLALQSYNEALEIAVEDNDKENELSIYISLGSYYGNRSDNEIALEYFFKAISIAEQLGNKEEQLVKLLGNIRATASKLSFLNSQYLCFHEQRHPSLFFFGS